MKEDVKIGLLGLLAELKKLASTLPNYACYVVNCYDLHRREFECTKARICCSQQERTFVRR